jgi:hypothetical protein
VNGPDLTFGGTGDQSPRPSSEAVFIQNWRADHDVIVIEMVSGRTLVVDVDPGTEGAQPACRCYRCGMLLVVQTVVAQRYAGGHRPACGECDVEGRGW